MNLLRKTEHLPYIFDDFLTRDWFVNTAPTHNQKSTIPPVNIQETDVGFVVELAVPGFKKEEFSIELESDTLTISSEKKSEKDENTEEKYTRKEFSYRSFKRSFNLPETADFSKIGASYIDGVLKVSIPKKEEAAMVSKRLITIS